MGQLGCKLFVGYTLCRHPVDMRSSLFFGDDYRVRFGRIGSRHGRMKYNCPCGWKQEMGGNPAKTKGGKDEKSDQVGACDIHYSCFLHLQNTT